MQLTGVTALVIDDEPVIRQFMEIALSDMGCVVETLATCESGLKRILAQDFDVVFVDKNLPDDTGLKVCEALKGADCKVALVTGYANLNSAVEALHHGVAEYFVKPLDVDDLRARLVGMLKELNLERENRALIAALRHKCEELERLAVRDPVTRLFNHAHFQLRLQGESKRSSGQRRFSLALIAIDKFAAVNEQLGHQGGDQILAQLGKLLSSSAEGGELFSEQDVACRLDGDTFAVILPELAKAEAASKLHALRESVAAWPCIPGQKPISLSMSIAEFPADGADSRGILAAARAAIARAKSLEGDCLVFFDPQQLLEQDDGKDRARRLHSCLQSNSVRFDYQPIVSTSARRPVAYEALCRPTCGEFAHIGELLVAAGEAGQLIALGQMLREVAVVPLADLAQPGLLFLNVHPHELNGRALFELGRSLKSAASRVVLEITETEEIRDLPAARAKLQQLRDEGFRIALDDFGAGYQGFGSLALLEPDYVKLDMAIVRGIMPDSRTARLVRHIREFCETYGISTIAEGVETVSEYRTLTELGIDLMQGYLFARPSSPFCVPEFPEKGQSRAP